MKKLNVYAVLSALLCLSGILAVAQEAGHAKKTSQGATTPSADLSARLDRAVHYWGDDGLFSGAVLVAKGDTILFSKGYGYANREWKIPNDPKGKFRIGSLTKQFTAVAILKLEKRGALSVNDKLGKYISNIPDSWSEITLQQALTHTSGIPNYTAQKAMSQVNPISLDGLIDLVRNVPLDFPPGTKYEYSNTNFFLLGAVVEKASGQKYEDFLQQNEFGPLGLKDTGYDHSRAFLPWRVAGYNRNGPNDYENCGYMDMTVPFAAGALYSTTTDLFHWDRALYGGRVLDADQLKRMTTPVLKDYGYGLEIDEVNHRKRYWHTGGINGFSAFLAYFPDEKLTVVALANTPHEAPKIGSVLAAAYHNDPLKMPKSVTVSEKTLKSYVGAYGNAKTNKTAFEIEVRDGKLLVKTEENGYFLVNESSTKFFDKVIGSEMVFTPGENGAPAQQVSILFSGGKDQKYTRLEKPEKAVSDENK